MSEHPARPEFRHVVWDWNGTLLDDTWLCIDVMNGLLAERGLPRLTRERYHAIFDFPVIEYYRRLGFDFARDPFPIIGAEFIRRYETRRLECGLQPGATRAIAHLGHVGLSQSVLSAYKQDTLEELLEHFGIRHHFGDVLGSDNVYAEGKVAQGRRWIARSGLRADSVLLVGDTTHDAEVAAAMGCSCLLVADGYHPRERLEPCGAPVVDNLDAFIRWLQDRR